MGELKLRMLRQSMGEVFYQWAESYFDCSGYRLNARVARQEMKSDYDRYCNGKAVCTASSFKRKLVAFCRFKGYDLNPSRPDVSGNVFEVWKRADSTDVFIGVADKVCGAEYFTVSNGKAAQNSAF